MSTPVQMQTHQVLALAVALSAVMYFLLSTAPCDVKPGAYTGSTGPLKPDSGKHHILVTGAAGFLGSHACKLFLQEGHAVTGVDNRVGGAVQRVRQTGGAKRRFQFVNADLGNAEALKEVFQRCKADVVVHFGAAAYASESVTQPLKYYTSVASNTINVLEAMKAAGVQELVYASTGAAYGSPVEVPVTEDSLAHATTPYARAALAAESAIRDAAAADPALNVAILRTFNVIGGDPEGALGEWPGPDVHRKVSRLGPACMDAAMLVTPHLEITGTRHATRDGTGVRDYVHVWDVARAHLLALSATANPPALFNVASGKGVSVREFVEACIKVTGVKFKVVEVVEARPGDCAEVWGDASKVKENLGWKPEFTDVEQGLKHAWAWRKRNPRGYST